MQNHGNSFANGPDIRTGSPVPFWARTQVVIDAKNISTTFWDLV
jgi:hypothetical protein